MQRHPQYTNTSDAAARRTADRQRQARRRVKLARKSSRNARSGRSVKAWKS